MSSHYVDNMELALEKWSYRKWLIKSCQYAASVLKKQNSLLLFNFSDFWDKLNNCFGPGRRYSMIIQFFVYLIKWYILSTIIFYDEYYQIY
jgi:hypothetical protein